MKYLLSIALTFLSALAINGQDHGHLNVGASGNALMFENGADFDPSTRYVKTLIHTNAGRYANRFQGNITLTALHSIDPFGVVVPNGPKPGSFVVGEIVSVTGPTGGRFSFWENTGSVPAVEIPVDTTNAAFRFDVSERGLGAGEPGGDAYGHIHGRRFTVNLPGVYTVGFRAHDTSTNGLNGGPLHPTSSGVQLIQFQAGINLVGLERQEAMMAASTRIGAMAGFSWQLQSATNLRNPEWMNVGGPIIGDDTFKDISDPHVMTDPTFYRAVGTPIEP